MEAVGDTSPVTYVMADARGEPIKGTFYGPELQKVTPDYFDGESIFDTHRRGNVMYLVGQLPGQFQLLVTRLSPDQWQSRNTPASFQGRMAAREAPRLHKVSRWRVPDWLLTAP